MPVSLCRFRKWLKEDGQAFQEVAGGLSDDGLYTVFASLRMLMPRGLHLVRFEAPGVAPVQRWFRGISKFTGLLPDDEDEESGATKSAGEFFYGGRTWEGAVGFWATEKSNGENGTGSNIVPLRIQCGQDHAGHFKT